MKQHPDYIKIPDLKDGYLYRILARNAGLGIWFKEQNAFTISRHKFGDNFLFEEYHWDNESFATAKPIEELEESPFQPSRDFVYMADVKTGSMFRLMEEEALKYLNEAERRFETDFEKELREKKKERLTL